MMPITRYAALAAVLVAGPVLAATAPQAEPQFHALRAPEKVVQAKPGSAPRQPAPITTRVVGTLDASGSVRMQCHEEVDAARAQWHRQHDPLAQER
jgi:hypothetical protein